MELFDAGYKNFHPVPKLVKRRGPAVAPITITTMLQMYLAIEHSKNR